MITFTVIAAMDETDVNLLFIYDKTERSNITKGEIERLLKDNSLK